MVRERQGHDMPCVNRPLSTQVAANHVRAFLVVLVFYISEVPYASGVLKEKR
jgi:hypothetical protein